MSELKFLHISDLHYLIDSSKLEKQWKNNYSYKEVMKDFLESLDYSDIDFVAITGDLTNDGDTQDYEELYTFLSTTIPKTIPVHMTLGNHDYKEQFKKVFNPRVESILNYSVTYQGYRLIFLDSSSEDFHHGRISEQQFEWLQNEMKEPSEKGTLIFQHHPYEIVWNDVSQRTEVPNDYYDFLREQDEIIGIFCGHLHQSRQSTVCKIPQYTVAPLSIGITEVGNTLYQSNRLGYNSVRVRDQDIDVMSEIILPEQNLYWPGVI